MIVVTGGAGFIGSALVWRLNQAGIEDILIVDHLGTTDKWKNLVNLRYRDYMHKQDFLDSLMGGMTGTEIDTIFHMGACSATTERDADYLADNNYRYSVSLANWCDKNGARFIYASSAATYGDGELGYSASDDTTTRLKPMNMYGYSKQMFDLYVMRKGYTNKMAGLKFFNVFGPNEYHKDDMRSVINKAFPGVRDTGKMSLFTSHKEGYADGEQKRDFIYVKDILEILFFFYKNRDKSGIFNAGTGTARTFKDLAETLFHALEKKPNIDFVPMPESLRDRYQYFTEADLDKLRGAGYDRPFTSLEDAIRDYVRNYLLQQDPYLGNNP